METEELIRLLANRLIDMEPGKREAAIEELKSWTNFCWSCGRTFGERPICHCENDE